MEVCFHRAGADLQQFPHATMFVCVSLSQYSCKAAGLQLSSGLQADVKLASCCAAQAGPLSPPGLDERTLRFYSQGGEAVLGFRVTQGAALASPLLTPPHH